MAKNANSDDQPANQQHQQQHAAIERAALGYDGLPGHKQRID